MKTLPKNLIRPLPVQDLEDEGFQRPALLIEDAPLRSGRRELKGDSAMKRGESENWDDLDAGCQAPFIGLSPRTDSYLRSNIHTKISRSF